MKTLQLKHPVFVDDSLVLPQAKIFATTRYAAFRCPVLRKQVYLHIYVMGKKPVGMVIDHIDGNTWNNQKANLRFITQQQNVWRKKKMKNNKSGFIGVFKKTNGRCNNSVIMHCHR